MALAQFGSTAALTQPMPTVAATIILETSLKQELEPIVEEVKNRIMTPSLVSAAPYTS